MIHAHVKAFAGESGILKLIRLLVFVRAEFAYAATPARTFALMVALTGCDFTMNLPAAGPTKIWAQRHMARTADVTEFAGMLVFVMRVYNSMFSKHVCTITKQLQPGLSADDGERLYTALSASVKKSHGIAPRTKESFWAPERMHAHVRNSLWTLSYWSEAHAFPDPLAGDHGFERRGAAVGFVGLAPIK